MTKLRVALRLFKFYRGLGYKPALAARCAWRMAS